MKKLLLTTALIMIIVITFGQKFEKGNVIGHHVFELKLDPNVTFDQYYDILVNKYFKEFNKEFNGEIQLYIGEYNRGKHKNMYSTIYLIKSVEVRDKYFPVEDEKNSELFQSKVKKIQDELKKEFDKLGESKTEELFYDDWVIM